MGGVIDDGFPLPPLPYLTLVFFLFLPFFLLCGFMVSLDTRLGIFDEVDDDV